MSVSSTKDLEKKDEDSKNEGKYDFTPLEVMHPLCISKLKYQADKLYMF